MAIQTPDWVKHAVFYQIFPDRFAASPRTKHPRGIQFKPWGTPPEEQGFQGGDLRGIVDKLDYLEELGINALYLNPVFSSASNHRYHTYDYMQVDPLLGGNEALRELLDEAHARDMHVILDGVFNHTGRGFWAFHHILECGGNSPYLDWFIVQDWPLHPYPNNSDEKPNYAAWWDLPALPKFNIENPGVRDHLLAVARHWIEFGADGWRLDVPEEIEDVAFWQAFRNEVKTANPEAYITGEIWHAAPEWLQGDRFDAVMNYIFSRIALGFFAAETLRDEYEPGGFKLMALTAAEFLHRIEEMLGTYAWEVNLTQLNLMDSHDTARTLWTVGGDESALRLSVLFQMTMPGAPSIYYGDEIGMTGGDDPGCRGAFPWHDQDQWNLDLLAFHRKAIAMRHAYPVLRTGGFHSLLATSGICAYGRALGDDKAVVVFNTNNSPIRVNVPVAEFVEDQTAFTGIWNEGEYVSQQGALREVTVPARDALVLHTQPEN
jgi:neopullulanase